MTIEERAEKYADTVKCEWENDTYWVDCRDKVEDAYIAGAKENGIEWHDLCKDPNDLPKDTYDVLDQAGYKVHYNFFQNVWVNEKDEIDNQVIAWCEIPQFEGV